MRMMVVGLGLMRRRRRRRVGEVLASFLERACW